MTLSNTAPTGAASRRPCADGTTTRARKSAKITAAKITTAFGLGLVANLVIVEAAFGPAGGSARAALPVPTTTASLASPSAPAFGALPEREPIVRLGSTPLAPTPVEAAAAFRVKFDALATQIAAAQIRERVGRVAAGLPETPRTLERLFGRVRSAIANERRTVRYGEMRVARWIVRAVEVAAARTGADPVFMMALADKESSLRPGVGASTSSAQGLYQFIEQTWLQVVSEFGPDHGLADEADAIEQGADGRYRVADEDTREAILSLRRDPLISGLMAGEMLKRDRARLEATLGRRLAPHEIYIAHFLGPGGAEDFLTLKDEAPETSAASAFAAAARANKAIFYRSGTARTIAEVDEAFAAMIGTRIDRYVVIDPHSESARARRLATILAHGAAVYASLKDALDQATGGDEAVSAADAALRLAAIDGKDGETVPLPPRAPSRG